MTAIALLALLGQEQTVRADREAACIECHTDIPDEWKGSVHHEKQVGCVSCHGADTVSPKQSNPHTTEFRAWRKNPFSLCGKCHAAEAEIFKAGKHFSSEKPKKMAKDCLTCHANHATERATFEKLRKHCIRCHAAGSPESAAISLFEGGISDVRAGADGLEGDLKAFLAGPGASDRRARGDLEALRTSHAWLRQMQHGVKVGEFSKESARAAALAREARAELVELESSRKRRPLWLGAFLAVMALNLWVARAWARRRFGGGTAAPGAHER